MSTRKAQPRLDKMTSSSSTRTKTKHQHSFTDKERPSHCRESGPQPISPALGSDVPQSLRNAPPELRVAIRRQQNVKNAQRRRDRERAKMETVVQKTQAIEVRIKQLQGQVEELAKELMDG